MRTVEIDEEVLESMFEQVEYLHSLVRTIFQTPCFKETG